MPTVIERTQQVRRQVQERIDAARKDISLSDEGRRREMARAVVPARKQLEALRAEHAREQDEALRSAARAVFGPPKYLSGGGDPAMRAFSYRDAVTRAGELNTGDEAGRLFELADATEDDLFARALAGRAVDAGWRDIVEAYGELDPGWAKAVRDYQAILAGRGPGLEQSIGRSIMFRLDVPAELKGHNVERLASEPVRDVG